MISQDERLLPSTAVADRALNRPLRDIAAQQKPYGVTSADPMHLRDYLAVILKRKWLILTLVLVITSLAAVQMYRLPSIYEAQTTIQIEPKPASVLETKAVIINAQNDPAYWQTQLRLLENPALARQAVLTLDLQNNPEFFGGQTPPSLLASVRRIFSRKTDASANASSPATLSVVSDAPSAVLSQTQVKDRQLSPEEQARLEPYEDALAGGLKVEPIIGTSLVNLRFQHTNPDIAQKVANGLADVFVYNNLDRMTSGTEKSSELLAKKIAELQLAIRQQEEARLNYARNHDLPETPDPAANLAAKRLQMLSEQVLTAENDRKNAQSLYEAAAAQPDVNAVPEVLDNKRVQSLREKLDTLREKRAELLVTYTPQWPAVRKIDEQMIPIQEQLTKAPREVISSLKSKYESARAREASLRQSYEQQKRETSQQNQSQIAMSALNQELETNKQYFNTLLQRQRELQITGNEKTNNVSVVTYARRPPGPIGPPRARNVFIAFLLSLAASIGLAFLLDYLDDTLKSVEDIERYVHLPTLALIPATRNERARLPGYAASEMAGGGTTALALIDDVRSPVSEAYRHLRTSLLLSSAGQPPKTILVTSSQPSEGKTTTAVNTAVTLAQTGAEVVIIDCDLRRPRLHAHFNVPNTHGVTNYLSGEKDLDALLHTYDKLPNLKLLPSGPVPPNPAELLGSDEMQKLINTLDKRFTHIIIDSPPAISFTDASILSTMVDGVMLVVHGGRSSRAVVRRAKQQLIDVGANIFGVVLNNVKLESQHYYYYGGYYASYYESADEGDNNAPGGSVDAAHEADSG